jgi:signal transduction histidine kinase
MDGGKVRTRRAAAIGRPGELAAPGSVRWRTSISPIGGMRTLKSGGSVAGMRRIPLDAVLLPVLAAVGVVEALSDDKLTTAGHVVGVVCSLITVAILAFRRRAPELTFVAVFAVCAVWLVGAYGWRQGPFAGFLDLVIATYALGFYGRGRRAIYVFAAVMAVGVGPDIYGLARGLSQAGDVLPSYIWLVTAFVAGVTLQRRELLATLLSERAYRAERERELRAREAVADERARIARELHDVVAHDVSVMVVQAQGADRILEGAQPEVRQALAAIEATGREAIDEMRRLLGILRRSDDELTLAPQPSLSELDALVAGVREAGLPVELEVVGDPTALPPGVDLSAYRIVQEALTNALKHAGPAHARVVVRYGADAVELEVSDDGPGGVDAHGTGHGLVGMRERVALYGGDLEAGSRNEGGWALRARLPLGVA